MHRKLLPLVALTAVLAGACASGSQGSTAGTTSAPSASRGVNDGGREGGRRGPGGPGGRRNMDQQLFRGITLSADQQKRIDDIRAKYRSQMEQERQQARNGGQRPDRAAMRQRMEQQNAEIRAVLTADQQTIYDQNLAQMRQQMQEQMQQRRGGQDPQR